MNNYTQEEAKAIVVSVLKSLIKNKYPTNVFHGGFVPYVCIPVATFEEIMAIWGIKQDEIN